MTQEMPVLLVHIRRRECKAIYSLCFRSREWGKANVCQSPEVCAVSGEELHPLLI